MKLSVDTFMHAVHDKERTQYEILNALKECKNAFDHKLLYPTFEELIEFRKILHTILKSKESLELNFPQQITGFDEKKQELIFEPTENQDFATTEICAVIVWSLPHITRVIDEGTTIFDFVYENISVIPVELLPLYHTEGFCFMQDPRNESLYLYKYNLEFCMTEHESYRTLHLTQLDYIKGVHFTSPHEFIPMKRKIIKQFSDFPNPATLLCSVKPPLEFSYEETLLPVAREKLIRELALLK